MRSKSIDYRSLCLEACEIVKETGSFILRQRQGFSSEMVEVKGNHDFVSYVDKTAELMLVERFDKLLPSSGFLVEEKSVAQSKAEFQWIIDPLDGTTNFIHGVPLYSVSVALYHEDRPVAGIIYEVNQNELFYTWEAGSAFLNGQKIQVSTTEKLHSSLLATGFPYTDYGKVDEFMDLIRWTMVNTRGLRRLGSAALDLAWVACGRFDGFFEYGLNPWDVAAGAFLVQQAGGHNSDFTRGENYLHGREIISCNPKIYDQLYTAVNRYLAKK